VAGLVGRILGPGQRGPRRARVQDPQDAVQDLAAVPPPPAFAVEAHRQGGQERLNLLPLVIGQVREQSAGSRIVLEL